MQGTYEEYIERAENCRRCAHFAQSDWAKKFWDIKAEYFQNMADNMPVVYLRDEYKAIQRIQGAN